MDTDVGRMLDVVVRACGNYFLNASYLFSEIGSSH